MTKRVLFVLPAVLVLASCAGEREARQAGEPPPTNMAVSSQHAVAASESSLQTQALLRVEGEVLTRFEADLRIRQGLARMSNRVPPEQIPSLRQKLEEDVREQFINTVLLRKEAERRDIGVTPAEEKQAFAQIRENLPQGVTLDTVMENSPMGKQQMREEVLTGIKINKLLASVTNAVQVSDERISRFYDENQDKLQVPETVHARHILISVDEDAAETEREARRQLAVATRQRLLQGADFAELAAEVSDCPTKNRGGDLGTFKRGRMVKAFEDAAFTQEEDDIGPVVATKFGYHIIQVLAHQEPHTMDREQVADILRRQLRHQAVQELVESLRKKADIRYLAP